MGPAASEGYNTSIRLVTKVTRSTAIGSAMFPWIGNTWSDRYKRPGDATDGVSLLPPCRQTSALLEVSDLCVSYAGRGKTSVVVEKLNFLVSAGELVGMQGRSGCGKTSIALALLKLLPSSANVTGAAFFRGSDLLQLKDSELRKMRGHEISIIYQEPALALNPVIRVGDQIAEVLRAHVPLTPAERLQQALQMLDRVQLGAERYFHAYPHELSGGERHRIVLAQALVCRPALVIADEPTAGLDSTLKNEILQLIDALRRETGTAFLLISHDRTVTGRADRTIDLSPTKAPESFLEPEAPSHVDRAAVASSEPTSLISVRNLSKCYRSRGLLRNKHAEKPALYSVGLDIAKASLTAIVGPSGSGKSTLARCLALLEEADEGEIFFEGKNLLDLRGEELRAFRPRLQYVFQDPAAALNPRLSAAETISEPLVIQNRLNREDREKRVRRLMLETGLDPATANRSCHEFSGGQKQRLAIARALALEPRLLIFDESLSGLDPETRNEILDLLKNLRCRLGITQLLISHDVETVSTVADSIVLMRNGRIVEHRITEKTGNSNTLSTEHVNPQTQHVFALSEAQ